MNSSVRVRHAELADAVGFDVIQHPRRRHAASLGMAVAHDRRGEGICAALFTAAI